jgi:hypothetical protein
MRIRWLASARTYGTTWASGPCFSGPLRAQLGRRVGPAGPRWGYVSVEPLPRRGWWALRRHRVTLELGEERRSLDVAQGEAFALALGDQALDELAAGHTPDLEELYLITQHHA